MGGKLHVFTATRPTVGESPIKNREGAPAAAKPKEGTPTQLQPDGEFYKNLAVDCSKQQVCVDVWSCAGSYMDLATLGQVSKPANEPTPMKAHPAHELTDPSR